MYCSILNHCKNESRPLYIVTWQPINFMKEVNVLVLGHFVTKPLHPEPQRSGSLPTEGTGLENKD